MKLGDSTHFEEWERYFIYLAYPDNKTKEIASILNKSMVHVKNYANMNKIPKQDVVPIKIGDIFGNLTVIEKLPNKGKQKRWKCECACGKFSECSTGTLTTGHSKSCGCGRIAAITHSFKDISGTWYNSFIKNAKKRKLECNLSKEYIQSILEQQDYKCKLSGLPISIFPGRNCKNYYENTTASLDRIDNNQGYVEGNVQFLHKHVNYMKWAHNQDYFLELCKEIVNHQSTNNNN